MPDPQRGDSPGFSRGEDVNRTGLPRSSVFRGGRDTWRAEARLRSRSEREGIVQLNGGDPRRSSPRTRPRYYLFNFFRMVDDHVDVLNMAEYTNNFTTQLTPMRPTVR